MSKIKKTIIEDQELTEFGPFAVGRKVVTESFYCAKCEIQEKQLKTLKDFAKKAIETNEFYGDTEENTWICEKSFMSKKYKSFIILNDCDIFENGYVNGGKKAREFQNSDIYKQVKEMIK